MDAYQGRSPPERAEWRRAAEANAKRFVYHGQPMGRRHLVLLGAGASLAALPHGDKYGRSLPLMADFIDTVDGLKGYLADHGLFHESGNIETLYARLAEEEAGKPHLTGIEEIISQYFTALRLPDEPTLYDHIVLSLRPKDMIATFNWDGLLMQAWERVGQRIGPRHLPRFGHLHGNVAEGYCDGASHTKMVVGPVGITCKCGQRLSPVPLLYPISKKDYASHPAIKSSWDDFNLTLEKAYVFTIFGYSAPASDSAAVALMQKAWGEPCRQKLRETDIVDIVEPEILMERWRNFINRRQYSTTTSWYNTRLARYPRRSCDSVWGAKMQLDPWAEQPIPPSASWELLMKWVAPLIEQEKQFDTEGES